MLTSESKNMTTEGFEPSPFRTRCNARNLQVPDSGALDHSAILPCITIAAATLHWQSDIFVISIAIIDGAS